MKMSRLVSLSPDIGSSRLPRRIPPPLPLVCHHGRKQLWPGSFSSFSIGGTVTGHEAWRPAQLPSNRGGTTRESGTAAFPYVHAHAIGFKKRGEKGRRGGPESAQNASSTAGSSGEETTHHATPSSCHAMTVRPRRRKQTGACKLH